MKTIEHSKEKIFKYIVLAYFIISPIFDLVFLYNRVTTLLRVLCLLTFVVVTLIINKESRKKVLYLLAFYLAMLAFLVVEYFHSRGFTSLVPNATFNFVSEASTLLKLCMPFTVLFIMKFLDVSKKEFFFVINSWIVIVAGSVVFTNLIGFSLASYTDEITRYSIFSWGQNLSVNDIATKGFFMYANQVSILLLMFLVLAFYEVIEKKKGGFVLLIVVVLAMWMLGTRLSTYGGLLALIAVVILYFVYMVFYKKKVSGLILFPFGIVGIWCLMLPSMPCSSRVNEIENAKKGLNSAIEVQVEGAYNISDEKVIEFDENLKYIMDNINQDTVGRQFYIEYYPYTYDMDFWKKVIEYQKDNYIDYRKIERMIVDRIWEIDGRKSNVIFGLSNSVIQSVVNIERDFVLQLYAFGIIGFLITMSSYIYISIICLKNLKCVTFLQLLLMCSFGLFIIGSYMTGNSLNFLATIVPCAFIAGFVPKYKDC